MKRLQFIDYATQAYLACVGVLVLIFHGQNLPRWPFYVVAHAMGLGMIFLLVRAYAWRPQNRLLEWLRHFYPIPLYVLLYCETGWLNQLVVSGYLDRFFFRLDQQIFGCQPSLALMAKFPSLWVSEVFYAAYFSYYLMIPGVGLALFLRRRAVLYQYLAVLSFLLYACFLIYIALPVAGPILMFSGSAPLDWLPEYSSATGALSYPASVEPGLFFQILKFIYAAFETPGAAFPSSHVAAAMTTLYFSWRHLPRIRWFHAAAVALLCVATVYCRYHYAVDVLAGMLTAAVLIPLGCFLHEHFPHRVSRSPGPV